MIFNLLLTKCFVLEIHFKMNLQYIKKSKNGVLSLPTAGVTWFDPFDCASWVIRAFDKMHEYGAQFNQSVHLNYTKAVLYSKKPTCVGNATTVYQNKGLLESLKKFYSYFQSRQSMVDVLAHLIEYFPYFLLYDTFYLYYNDEYWHLPLQYPYIQITYEEVPLPGP